MPILMLLFIFRLAEMKKMVICLVKLLQLSWHSAVYLFASKLHDI